MSIDVSGISPAATTHSPEVGTVTVPVKTCCGVLAGEGCDCREFAAEARGVFANAIMCRPAGEWGVA